MGSSAATIVVSITSIVDRAVTISTAAAAATATAEAAAATAKDTWSNHV